MYEIQQIRPILHEVLGDLYDSKKVPAFLESGSEMVKWMEENSTEQFKPVPLPDYHVSKKGASSGRTILTQEFDGRRLESFIKQVRYPLQGYSARGSMQADPAELPILTNPFGSITNFTLATKKILRYALDLARYGKGTAMANGNALVWRLLFSLQQQRVEFWNNSTATKPIIDDGRVIGLRVLRDGKGTTIYAHRGVVLASGGFGRSEEATQFVPHEWLRQPTRQHRRWQANWSGMWWRFTAQEPFEGYLRAHLTPECCQRTRSSLSTLCN